jgi:hypothetical protein
MQTTQPQFIEFSTPLGWNFVQVSQIKFIKNIIDTEDITVHLLDGTSFTATTYPAHLVRATLKSAGSFHNFTIS